MAIATTTTTVYRTVVSCDEIGCDSTIDVTDASRIMGGDFSRRMMRQRGWFMGWNATRDHIEIKCAEHRPAVTP